MRDLNYRLRQLCQRNRDGSFATRARRARELDLCARQLHELGYTRFKDPHQLKGRHVTALVERWKAEGLSAGTIKARMASLRWWAEKVGRESVIDPRNAAYGIADRRYVTNESKAVSLGTGDLDKVPDVHLRASLELQRAFGLRREECLKLQPHVADRGDRLVLKASWCKGGREREIPIRTAQQREVLNQAHRLAGRGSMISSGRSYVEQVKLYERQTAAAGLHKLHGLRHAYAQERYKELTGWAAPAAGGKPSARLTREEKALDREARMTISGELGHGREQITAVYLGR